MRYSIVIIMCGLVASPAIAADKDVIEVPSSISGQASFSKQSDENQKELVSYVAQGGADGACAVVAGAALVCGTKDSRFTSNETAKTVKLDDGGFLLHVGKKPVTFELDGAKITIKQAALALAKTDGKWILMFVTVFKGGEAEIETSLAVQSPSLDDKPSGFSAVSYKKKILQGQKLAVSPSSVPSKATDAERFVLKDVTKRLSKTTKTTTPLVAIDVEHPSDLEAAALAKDEMFQDIEIEEIEVEAGCIEVCLD